MTEVHIRHRTTFAYRRPVRLNPHRLRLRPRESRDLTLISSQVETTPASVMNWAHDVFGNSVATAVFSAMTDRLTIEAVSHIELRASAWPVFDIAASAIVFPFRYPDDEWTDLGALSQHQYPDPEGRLKRWARGFVGGARTDTLALLKDLNAGVSRAIRYRAREEEGTQSPARTLELGVGSCRDYAVLFAEAARALGFGARIVSGYLFNPGRDLAGSADSGSTHAWAEVYVSGAGWIPFDPTNQGVGGHNLIPAGVARDIGQIMPVVGSFAGEADGFECMSVEVDVTERRNRPGETAACFPALISLGARA